MQLSIQNQDRIRKEVYGRRPIIIADPKPLKIWLDNGNLDVKENNIQVNYSVFLSSREFLIFFNLHPYKQRCRGTLFVLIK